MDKKCKECKWYLPRHIIGLCTHDSNQTRHKIYGYSYLISSPTQINPVDKCELHENKKEKK